MLENKNFNVVIVGLFICFFILLARLFQLQVIFGKENRYLAENNRIQKKIIRSPRGLIVDRKGEILAENSPCYLLDDKEISRDEALDLQVNNKDNGLSVRLKRNYPASNYFSHLLGYLGEVSEEELNNDKLQLKGYSLGSLVGRSGIESEYESFLKGYDGGEMIEVDTLGKVVRRMGRILPDAGKTMTLAIDKKLQEAAGLAFSQGTKTPNKGVIIATNPKNGEVLVLYSSPTFDNKLFSDSAKNSSQINNLINDEENQPLLNRAISGLYSPGSIFKIVISIAGLEEGKIKPDTLINDPGILKVGQFKYANWYFTSYGKTEGEINVVKALARSTDTFFYKLGEMLGPEKIALWAQKFGLDKKSEIDLPGEVAGFIATPEWKKKARNENWFLGNTYHLAIGQGDVELTPLGVNLMTQAVANKGKVCTPRILKIGAENTLYKEECRQLPVNNQQWEIIKKGMIAACSEGGTGWPFFGFKPEGAFDNWRVACKTGTAETGDGKTTHAWFTVFAPDDDPEIVLTVLVEKGGEGSSVAAPIAKEILKEYFR